MAKRRVFTVTDVPLVGGALCLDFVNSTGFRRGHEPRERLHGYGDLLVWAERSGIQGRSEARALATEAAQQPRAANEVFREAIRLREDLYGLLAPLALGNRPAPQSVGILERWLDRASRHRTLQVDKGGGRWTWQGLGKALDSVLWPIVGSAENVVLRELDVLKQCGDCDWLFLDHSKNQSRRWCKKLCGDRARARRHYRRTRSSSSGKM